MRPSQLYQRLGLTGPTDELVSFELSGGWGLSSRLSDIKITHGGTLSRYSPATLSATSPDPTGAITARHIRLQLTDATRETLAARCHTYPEAIRWRFRGRAGQLTLTDHGRIKGLRGTRVVAASFGSLIQNLKGTRTMTAGDRLSQAVTDLWSPAWLAPYMTWTIRGETDTWKTTTTQPLDPAGALKLFEERLWLVSQLRDGSILLEDLESWEARAATAASSQWPLGRRHCLAPTEWTQGREWPTEYLVRYNTPTGESTHGHITGQQRIEELDWRATITHTTQYRRVSGLRYQTGTSWRLPKLEVPVDTLIASPSPDDRRAAGMVLGLNQGDPLALAGDWPQAFRGVHIVEGLEEHITHKRWLITISLQPYGALAGQNQLPVRPRTWDQTTGTWDQATGTWDAPTT